MSSAAPTIPPHPQLGAAQRCWHYRHADGTIFCSVARWDFAGKKEIRQFHVNGGGLEWKRPEGQAPLFGIDRIPSFGRVLIVAGEKTADAAQKLFPGWAVTTSLGGEAAYAKTDWSPVRGKQVTIWPDADAPGEKYSLEVANLCFQAGAKSIHIVNLPLDAPKGWDLADDPPAGWDLPAMLDEAIEYAITSTAPSHTTPIAIRLDADEAPESAPTNYPAELWTSRRWLAQLYRYAAVRELDPDLLFGAVLARVAAVVPKGTSMDTGIMSARASLNMMVAGIGATGSGKSQALATASRVVRAPSGVDGFIAGQIGSGEGIAEAFMGSVCNDPDAPKKERRVEKKQVRHNAFLFLDEGETLHKISQQKTNTTMPTIRSAAVGAQIGALNASAENRRNIENYHLGVFIGYQPCTVGPLLAEVAEGTPQRFLFCMAGPPADDQEIPGCALPVIELHDRPGLIVYFADDIQAEIRAEHRRRRAMPPSLEPDWQSHAMLLRCKVAALLSLVDHSESGLYSEVVVEAEQWGLARIICDTSHGIVRWLVSHAKEHAAEIAIERITAQAAAAQASQIAVRQAPATAESIARRIAQQVHEKGRTEKSELRRSLRSDKRHLFSVACDIAEAAGWIVDEANHLAPGQPPAGVDWSI